MNNPQYVLYFSHSWLPEHVDLNITLWAHLWEHCRLLVDDNQEEQPPYYISRLEHLVRRSDLFLAVLVPSLPRETVDQVSPYSLFEIALAERAGLPRLVLYDIRTHFTPSEAQKSAAGVRYIPFEIDDLVAGGGEPVWSGIADWLATAMAQSQPRPLPPPRRAAVLLPDGSEKDRTVDAIHRGLAATGFELDDLASASNDVEALAMLRSTDLLVADVGCETLWDLYGMAHALMVPTVRLLRDNGPRGLNQLPTILKGHSRGYHHDLVHWSELDQLERAIADRTNALLQVLEEIDDFDEGRTFFERRRR
jgi:hypothetical protein